MLSTESEYYLGLDIGSLSTKCVVIDAEREIVQTHVTATGCSPGRTGRAVYDDLLARAAATAVARSAFPSSRPRCRGSPTRISGLRPVDRRRTRIWRTTGGCGTCRISPRQPEPMASCTTASAFAIPMPSKRVRRRHSWRNGAACPCWPSTPNTGNRIWGRCAPGLKHLSKSFARRSRR